MSMSKYRNELTSPDEVSIASSAEEEEEEGTGTKVVRRKHRPKSLNINRSLSITSSEDEGDEKLSRLDSEMSNKESRKPTEKASSSTKIGAKVDPDDTMKPSGSRDGSCQHTDTDPSLQQQQPPIQQHQQQQQQQHMDYLSDGKPVRSPSPPRSPSWREGLESPPFSPRRRDSYPGKKRGHISPVSPKDKKFQFSYVDTSPTVHHHHSAEDIYESNHQGLSYREDELSPPRSPLTPDELKKAFVAACGQATHRDNSSRDILRKSSSSTSASPPLHQRENAKKDKGKLDLGMDTEVIDLATYAATIASNTACLTSLSVSPTNIPTSNIEGSELISPESITSTDSASPISPNYYDSSQSEEVEDVELADPATKSIDYQGTKRQKQRPPSSDWSPVIDLSPILDVSPSVEEAEQQEMLAQQQEVLRKRESELISESEEEDEEGSSSPEKKDMDKYVIPSLRRYMNFEDISKICEGKIPDEKKLERISDMLSDFQKINRDMEILTYPVLRSNGDKEHIVTTTPPTIATRSTTSDVVTTLPIARPPSATYTMAPISTVVTTSPASTTTISITDEEEADRVLHPLPARGMRPTISTSSLSELLDSGGEDSELMTVWNLAQANVISKPTPSLQTSTSVVTATSLAISATVVTSAATTCTVSQTDRPDGPPPPAKGHKPAIAPKPTPPAKPQPPVPAKPTDAGGAAKTTDAKPEPPPRVRRKLPEPTPEIMATQKPPKPPKPARTPSTCSLLTPTTKTAPVNVVPGQPTRPLPPPPPPSKSVKMLTEAFEVKTEAKPPPEIKPKPPVPEKKPPKPSVEPKPGKTLAPKPEPDKRRSKEIKTKVKPSAKEGEQPAPKVLDSPVTPPEPAVSNLKREYSDSTSVSPSSSPDHELYTYPSPGTPPESDVSPPKAHSPPSPRGESARSGKVSSRSQSDMKKSRGTPYSKSSAVSLYYFKF
ncbi:unnamed protein product [Acanthosepion pharaonis]|uniref:Uncharacterized protein n=1 Tax=Acanthosepion pharaonis TaxID=158019 RepID=A0A812B5R9_ACAPH|nr:unnamed protein product [Sepia pharaonis]